MELTETTYLEDEGILSRGKFEGLPITLVFDDVTETTETGEKVVYAGSTIGSDGKSTSGDCSSAIGILLHDVGEKRPQGTVLTHAYINKEAAEAHANVSYSSETSLPMIVFE